MRVADVQGALLSERLAKVVRHSLKVLESYEPPSSRLDDSQTPLEMAEFYLALARDGTAPTPEAPLLYRGGLARVRRPR
jgi:hypothetical protein